MKKVKNQNNSSFSTIAYTTYGAAYGKIIFTDRQKLKHGSKDFYFLGFKLDMFEFSVTLYQGEKKPRFKLLYLLTAIWTPVFILAHLITLLLSIFILLTGFYNQCLFRKSFITVWYETLSGYISLLLSIVGLISIIKFFF